jgi:hypothetical protein
MADIPENYSFTKRIYASPHTGSTGKYIFKHHHTGKELELDDFATDNISSRMVLMSKEQALKNYFKNKGGSTYAEGGEIEIEFEHKGNKHKHSFTPEEEDWWTSFESNGNSYDVHYDEDYGTISVYEYSDKGTDYANTVYSKKIMVKGGEVEMIEIDEDGSNVPPQLMDIFSEFNEDEDYYKEMERLKVKANKIGYDFSYGLDGTPTEFCEIPKKSWGGGIAIGTAVGGYVGYKIGRARTQKKGFETEKKIGRGIKKTFSKKK